MKSEMEYAIKKNTKIGKSERPYKIPVKLLKVINQDALDIFVNL